MKAPDTRKELISFKLKLAPADSGGWDKLKVR